MHFKTSRRSCRVWHAPGWWFRCAVATSTRPFSVAVWNEVWPQTEDSVASWSPSAIEREVSPNWPNALPASASGQCLQYTGCSTPPPKKNSKPLPSCQYIIPSRIKAWDSLNIFFVCLRCQTSTIILPLGSKYSTCDLISDVNYCSWAEFVRSYNADDISAPSDIISFILNYEFHS